VIQTTLENALASKRQLDINTFQNEYYKLKLFIPTIHAFWNKETEDNFAFILESIVQHKLRPLACKHASSRFWTNRYFSAQFFYYFPNPDNKEFIVKLIDDKTTLIVLSAISAAVKLGSYDVIAKAIDTIATHRKLSESIFVRCFQYASTESRQHVVDKLKASHDPYTKACCYRVLVMYTEKYCEQARNDVFSEHQGLRIEAIRNLQFSKGNKDVLRKLLSADDWESRCQAVKTLGAIKAVDMEHDIALLLKDESWWVRYNAANALKSLGASGILILKSQVAEDDLYAYQISQFVLEDKVLGDKALEDKSKQETKS